MRLPILPAAFLLVLALTGAAPPARGGEPLVIVVHGVGGGNRPDDWAKDIEKAWGVGPVEEVTYHREGRTEIVSYGDFAPYAGDWALQVQRQIKAKLDANPGRPVIIVSHSWGSVATSIALSGGMGGGFDPELEGHEYYVPPIALPPGRVQEWITVGSPLGRAYEGSAPGNLRQLNVQVATGRPSVVEHWSNFYDVDDPVSSHSHRLEGADNVEVSGSASGFDPTGVGAHTGIWTNPRVRQHVRETFWTYETPPPSTPAEPPAPPAGPAPPDAPPRAPRRAPSPPSPAPPASGPPARTAEATPPPGLVDPHLVLCRDLVAATEAAAAKNEWPFATTLLDRAKTRCSDIPALAAALRRLESAIAAAAEKQRREEREKTIEAACARIDAEARACRFQNALTIAQTLQAAAPDAPCLAQMLADLPRLIADQAWTTRVLQAAATTATREELAKTRVLLARALETAPACMAGRIEAALALLQQPAGAAAGLPAWLDAGKPDKDGAAQRSDNGAPPSWLSGETVQTSRRPEEAVETARRTLAGATQDEEENRRRLEEERRRKERLRAEEEQRLEAERRLAEERQRAAEAQRLRAAEGARRARDEQRRRALNDLGRRIGEAVGGLLGAGGGVGVGPASSPPSVPTPGPRGTDTCSRVIGAMWRSFAANCRDDLARIAQERGPQDWLSGMSCGTGYLRLYRLETRFWQDKIYSDLPPEDRYELDDACSAELYRCLRESTCASR